MNTINKKNFFKKKTLVANNGNEVSFCLDRGGIISSLKLSGKETLYFDNETFLNSDKSIRGGIPILFPNAGPVRTTSFLGQLPQHGFVRDMQWQGSLYKNFFENKITSSKETLNIYPYDFILTTKGFFNDDGSFTFSQKIENTGKEILPISCGLHPYFKVNNSEKKNIVFNFSGGEMIQEKFSEWSEGNFISIDNPKIIDPSALLNITIPDLGDIILDYSKEYQKIWIWSLPGKDFVCIEPVMRDVNGIHANPHLVRSGEMVNSYISINLK